MEGSDFLRTQKQDPAESTETGVHQRRLGKAKI